MLRICESDENGHEKHRISHMRRICEVQVGLVCQVSPAPGHAYATHMQVRRKRTSKTPHLAYATHMRPSVVENGTRICDAYAAQWQLQWQDTHMLRIFYYSGLTPPRVCPRICFAYACGGAQLFGFARRTRICVAYATHMRVSCIWGARNLHLVRAQVGWFCCSDYFRCAEQFGPFPFPVSLSPPFPSPVFYNQFFSQLLLQNW